jgi:hypothetical protein
MNIILIIYIYIINEINPVKLKTPNPIPTIMLNTILNQNTLSNFLSFEDCSEIITWAYKF